MSELSVMYITFDSKKSCKEMARLLLKENLIACANIYKIDSLYNWKSKVAEEKEFVLWAKTKTALIPKIEDFVKEKHSYDVPCIVNFEFNANAAYAKWVKEECR